MRLGLDFLKFFPVEVDRWGSDDLKGHFITPPPRRWNKCGKNGESARPEN